jgi:hypothetical protein
MNDSMFRRVVTTAAVAISACILFVAASCATLKQSAFQGSISGTDPSTTYIDIGSGDAVVRLTGTVTVTNGTCRVILKDPKGKVVLDERVQKTYTAKFDRDAVHGVWLLEVGGLEEEASGKYDLVLSNGL